MADLTDLTEDTVARPSRRKVLVASAWAVPVVMGVGAAPEAAASSVLTADATLKKSGNIANFVFNITTDVVAPGASVTITSISSSSPGANTLTWTTDPRNHAVTLVNGAAQITGVSSTAKNTPKALQYTVAYRLDGASVATLPTVTFAY